MVQGSSLKQWFSEVYSRPIELICGLCIFATAAAGGAVESVASPSLAILFLTCLFYIRSWPDSWRQLSGDERLILIGFGLYAFSAMLAYYNVNDEHEYIKHLGRYVRFLVLIPIYLLLSKTDLRLFKYLLMGAIASGPLYLVIAFVSIADRPGLPAQGGYHHITFGDMVMLNALFMTTVLVAMNVSKRLQIVLIVSIACALYASLLSQARGAWLALPFYLPFLFYAAIRFRKLKLRTVLITMVVLVAILAMSPIKDILTPRVQEAIQETELFLSGEQSKSSVGGRLAMWHVAVNVWKKHPFIGTGPGDFDEDLQANQAQGLYEKINVHSSVHNIYLQALATTGTIGFVAILVALLVLPFRLFYKTTSSGKMNIASLCGMVTITAFAVFGLTESWILRSPVVAVYVIYFVTLATTASKSATAGNIGSNIKY